MYTLVLVRHGESQWNLENRFTGWTDVDLTEKGREEAREAGRLLRDGGYDFDVAYTSVLKRAIRTLWIALDEMDRMWLPVIRAWQLNERHYGALQGLNKSETAAKFGEDQVKVWRRSYSTPPPVLTPEDERFPGHDRRYASLTKAELPLTESLKETVARAVPYWESVIAPEVKAGRRVLVAAHGNSLRAMVKYLDGISDDEIVGLNIPTGVPLVYHLDDEPEAREELLPRRRRGGEGEGRGRREPGEEGLTGARRQPGKRRATAMPSAPNGSAASSASAARTAPGTIEPRTFANVSTRRPSTSTSQTQPTPIAPQAPIFSRRSKRSVVGERTSATHSGASDTGVSFRSGQPVVERRHAARSGTSRERFSSDRISGSTTKSHSGAAIPSPQPKRSLRAAAMFACTPPCAARGRGVIM